MYFSCFSETAKAYFMQSQANFAYELRTILYKQVLPYFPRKTLKLHRNNTIHNLSQYFSKGLCALLPVTVCVCYHTIKFDTSKMAKYSQTLKKFLPPSVVWGYYAI